MASQGTVGQAIEREPITIYGDRISGNCMRVRFVAEKLGIPYQWIETSVLKGETRTPEFLAINPAGQVPVVVLRDGRILAQSNAIMLYLAEGTSLIPTDAYERAFMMQWLFWEQYSHETAIAVRRFHKSYLKKPESEIDPSLKPRGERALSLMDRHLADRRYFVGDRITLADIALVAYTRWADEADFDLANWPHVRHWVARIEQDLGLRDASVSH
jgi:glutathione S-transferase